MHFTIPHTEECNEENGSSYIGYKVNVNGEYHCTVRYKQLHNLNEQLKKYHGSDNVPYFPPKKYWPLTPNQIEERRSLLEKYVQSVGQSRVLMNSDIFNKFLITAQQESSGEPAHEVTVEVFLMNGFKLSVAVNSNENSSSVLEKVCNQLNLPITYMYYFSLFMIKRDNGGDITIVRKLLDFESPYISQKTIKGSHKIFLRKSYWDSEYDLELMTDRVGLNLLYVQTVSDVERGWVLASKEVHAQLATLQARGAKQQYLEVARRLKYYGYTQLRECVCDYPVAETRVLVSAGGWELVLRPVVPATSSVLTRSFRVTRMRCWRITSHSDEGGSGSGEVELSFQYLMGRDKLEWVTLTSGQTVLISVLLQSMVDELLLKKSGISSVPSPPLEGRGGSLKYLCRDGSSQLISLSQSTSAETLSSPTNGSTVMSPVRAETTMSMRRLSEKLSGLTKSKGQPLVENHAFDGITDEDL